MYYTTHPRQLKTQKIFLTAIKLFEGLKLYFTPSTHKTTENKESLSYISNSIKKGSTIIDFGRHRRTYLFEMLKIAGHSGELIIFEQYPDAYNYLTRMKRWLRLKNVTIKRHVHSERRPTATVINIKERIGSEPKNADLETADSYFLSNNIEPDLLKIQVDGKELQLFKETIQTLQIYKPRILLECSQARCSRENLVETFRWLTNLGYKGYFILDSLKIPLTSFDFNIYQNEVIGFYCNNFVFE